MNDNLYLTVAVPSYRRGNYLCDLLEQLAAQRRPADEIIVVDSRPNHDEATEQRLMSLCERLAVRRIVQNVSSLPRARNTALQHAKGDVVVFLDDDVRVPAGLLATYVNCFEQGYDAVAGVVLRPDGKPQFWQQFRLNGHQIDNLPGGNFALTRRTWQTVGPFDENFIGSAVNEDTDYAWRIAKAGLRTHVCQQAAVVHLVAPSGGCVSPGFDRATATEWHLVPRYYFLCKWAVWPEISRRVWQDIRRYAVNRIGLRRPTYLLQALWIIALSLIKAQQLTR